MPSESKPKNRKIKTYGHVRSLLAATARNLEQHKIDPKEATAMANLAGRLLDAIKAEQGETFEDRLAQLEELLSESQEPPGATGTTEEPQTTVEH